MDHEVARVFRFTSTPAYHAVLQVYSKAHATLSGDRCRFRYTRRTATYAWKRIAVWKRSQQQIGTFYGETVKDMHYVCTTLVRIVFCACSSMTPFLRLGASPIHKGAYVCVGVFLIAPCEQLQEESRGWHRPVSRRNVWPEQRKANDVFAIPASSRALQSAMYILGQKQTTKGNETCKYSTTRAPCNNHPPMPPSYV